MGVFARGNTLWIRYRDVDGKWRNASTGYPVGDEGRAHETLARSPHVELVAVTSHNPLTGELPMAPVHREQGNTIVPVSYMFVSPDYFTVLRLPISRGRGFTLDEARAESRVAVISASAAQALWPGADPLGKMVRVLMVQEQRPDVMTRQDLVSSSDVASAGQDVMVIGVTAGERVVVDPAEQVIEAAFAEQRVVAGLSE